MKLFILMCLVALAASAPPPPPRVNYPSDDVQLLRYENDNVSHIGNYRYSYEQSDGQKQEQQGELRNEGREDESLAVKGYYSWIGPDGVKYIVNYIADENGFQPEIEEGPGGAVPDAVLASLLG